MSELRDLEADRRLCGPDRWETSTKRQLKNIALAALDEIERLKRLLVWKNFDGQWTGTIAPCRISGDHPTEADAWAAVRKAAE